VGDDYCVDLDHASCAAQQSARILVNFAIFFKSAVVQKHAHPIDNYEKNLYFVDKKTPISGFESALLNTL